MAAQNLTGHILKKTFFSLNHLKLNCLVKLSEYTYLLEVVAHFKLVLLVADVGLDLGVGVVDDGQEHVHQEEEHAEYITKLI